MGSRSVTLHSCRASNNWDSQNAGDHVTPNSNTSSDGTPDRCRLTMADDEITPRLPACRNSRSVPKCLPSLVPRRQRHAFLHGFGEVDPIPFNDVFLNYLVVFDGRPI